MIGDRISHFRITAKLGEGGMGEVYRGRDTELGRDVAIKVLPPAMAGDSERLARFRREARLLASLSHPNIAAVYEVGMSEGRPFLVMELIEGETLEERIPATGMGLQSFFDVAIPLAEGLAEAHERGVTHRDLKPGNVMVDSSGRVKILDFGLARLEPEATAGDSTDLMVDGLTSTGAVLGTAPYMAPEQIRGQPADSRSDIFSLGCVLFEMITGRRPFGGANTPEVLASILRDEPPAVTEMRPDLPRQLGRIVHSCLHKDPDHRFQSALDVRNQLEDLREELRTDPRPEESSETVERGRPRWLLPVAVAAAVLLVGVAVWIGFPDAGLPGGESVEPWNAATNATGRLSISPLTTSTEIEQWPAWSPNGAELVFSREVGGFSQLFLREVEGGEERRLTRGERDDIQPAWLPDGSAIVFVRSNAPHGKLQPADVLSRRYEGGDVWLLDLATGRETKILEEAFNPSFAPDGSRLAVDASWTGPHRIWTTDTRGRNPRQGSTDASEAVVHTGPAWSPDGSRIVFQSEQKTRFDLRVVDPATGEVSALTDDLYQDLDPVWSPDGEFVYFASYRSGGLNIWRIPVAEGSAPVGAPQQLTFGAGQDMQPALAPDGSSLAFAVLHQNADLWRLPVDPETGSPVGPPEPLVTSTREDSRGAWSPDGSLIAFNSDRGGPMNIWLHSVASGVTRPLTRGEGGDYQPSWSPDGSTVAFFSSRSGNSDVWTVDVATGELRQITEHPALDTNPFISPDGKRLAFQSDRDGRKEVWVVELDDGAPRRLTAIGANDHFMRWSDDGRWIYFRSLALSENGVHRVAVDGAGEPEALDIPAGWHMSLSPDRSLLLDAVGHEALWIYPLDGSEPRKVFEPDARIDYPQWSPDGKWVVFDRADSQGADLWLLRGLTPGGG